MIAYSSVSHMGFCLLGMSAFTQQGIDGAVLNLWTHGLISPMLFLIVGVIYDRTHHRNIEGFGGLAKQVPEYAACSAWRSSPRSASRGCAGSSASSPSSSVRSRPGRP